MPTILTSADYLYYLLKQPLNTSLLSGAAPVWPVWLLEVCEAGNPERSTRGPSGLWKPFLTPTGCSFVVMIHSVCHFVIDEQQTTFTSTYLNLLVQQNCGAEGKTQP